MGCAPAGAWASPDEQGDRQATKVRSGLLEDSESSHVDDDWFSDRECCAKPPVSNAYRGLRQSSQADGRRVGRVNGEPTFAA
jgi:hypothetical protein